MAKRYSGNTIVDIRWVEAQHESPAKREKLARGCPHNGYYRCAIYVKGKHVDTGTVCAPAHLTHAIDSAEAYDDTAYAAITFADADGKLDRADFAFDDNDQVYIGRSEKERWPRTKPGQTSGKTGKGPPHIVTTFSRTTPESAEEGDFSETGWIDEEGVEIEADEDRTLEEAAARWLKDEGAMQASSGTHFHPGIWYSTEFSTIDYGTGEEEERSFHLKGFTPDQEKKIFQIFSTKRR